MEEEKSLCQQRKRKKKESQWVILNGKTNLICEKNKHSKITLKHLGLETWMLLLWNINKKKDFCSSNFHTNFVPGKTNGKDLLSLKQQVIQHE